MITTKDLRMVRGQQFVATFTVKDTRGATVNLDAYDVYMAVRADLKVDPTLKMTSAAGPPSGWVSRIVKALDQDGAEQGQFTLTMLPADTRSLVALGDSDPWLYDVWIQKTADETVSQPVIAMSKLALFPEITVTPFTP